MLYVLCAHPASGQRERVHLTGQGRVDLQEAPQHVDLRLQLLAAHLLQAGELRVDEGTSLRCARLHYCCEGERGGSTVAPDKWVGRGPRGCEGGLGSELALLLRFLLRLQLPSSLRLSLLLP